MSERAQGWELIRVPEATLGAIHRVLNDELSGGDAARALRRIGIESGGAFYRRFGEWLSEAGSGHVDPDSLNAEEFWGRLSGFFAHLGWGRLETRVVHPGILAVDLSNWVEARQHYGNPAGCHITTGLIAEILRHVAGGDLAALEVECDPSGGGSSRIIVGNTNSIDALYVSLQEGIAYDAAIAALP